MNIAIPRSAKKELRRRWPVIRRILTWGFFALVAALLISQARTIAWAEVGEALIAYDRQVLLTAAGFAFGVLLVYSCYDLVGRAYIYRMREAEEGWQKLPKRKVMLVTFVSYVFNLNLGALVGGFAFRYRLYSRLGLSNADITTVLGLSVATNWLGYCLLGGLVFAFDVLAIPEDWSIGSATLPIVGVVILAVLACYLLLCGWSGGRIVRIRGYKVMVPRLRIALLQLILSCAHWLMMSSILFVLLHQQVDFVVVLGVLLLSGIAGALTHVPGALGVLEAVFLVLLGDEVGRTELLAALLAYRAVFYLLPLLVASGIYLWMEFRFRQSQAVETG